MVHSRRSVIIPRGFDPTPVASAPVHPRVDDLLAGWLLAAASPYRYNADIYIYVWYLPMRFNPRRQPVEV